MHILQYAFAEGRDSKISWESSESLKKANLIEIQMINMMSNRKYARQPRKVAQLHPTTGRVVNVFQNLFSAARWINANRDVTVKVKHQQVFGNLKMQMVKAQLAYGYRWLYLEPDSQEPVTQIIERNKFLQPKRFIVLNNKTGEVVRFRGKNHLRQYSGMSPKETMLLMQTNKSSYNFGEYTVFSNRAYTDYLKTLPIIVRNEKGHFKGRYANKIEAANDLGVPLHDLSIAINYNNSISGVKLFYDRAA